mmetsp:Transcript_8283/g.27263  ORF Transcript_8283/g.27263 Transcript_8283/m.27263 type:complete len:438 (+) Transcript_8283:734-2047(+)
MADLVERQLAVFIQVEHGKRLENVAFDLRHHADAGSVRQSRALCDDVHDRAAERTRLGEAGGLWRDAAEALRLADALRGHGLDAAFAPAALDPGLDLLVLRHEADVADVEHELQRRLPVGYRADGRPDEPKRQSRQSQNIIRAVARQRPPRQLERRELGRRHHGAHADDEEHVEDGGPDDGAEADGAALERADERRGELGRGPARRHERRAGDVVAEVPLFGDDLQRGDEELVADDGDADEEVQRDQNGHDEQGRRSRRQLGAERAVAHLVLLLRVQVVAPDLVARRAVVAVKLKHTFAARLVDGLADRLRLELSSRVELVAADAAREARPPKAVLVLGPGRGAREHERRKADDGDRLAELAITGVLDAPVPLPPSRRPPPPRFRWRLGVAASQRLHRSLFLNGRDQRRGDRRRGAAARAEVHDRHRAPPARIAAPT